MNSNVSSSLKIIIDNPHKEKSVGSYQSENPNILKIKIK